MRTSQLGLAMVIMGCGKSSQDNQAYDGGKHYDFKTQVCV